MVSLLLELLNRAREDAPTDNVFIELLDFKTPCRSGDVEIANESAC